MSLPIYQITHPDFDTRVSDWDKWRTTYEGGRQFVERYLKKLSIREDTDDFNDRREMTPCAAFAKIAVNEVKDSIYERMADISREGGAASYQSAIAGLEGGVDFKGSSMNYFMGCKILPELLTMAKVGIFVDMPPLRGESLADNHGLRPYIYMYKAEQIRCWIVDERPDENEFAAVLLEENVFKYHEETGFPCGYEKRFRYLFKDEYGQVWAGFYNENGGLVDQTGVPMESFIPLDIDKIPFVLVEISESLMTDIADYQIALTNLGSSDIVYALKANYPFYTEQYEPRANSQHLRKPGETGEATDANTGKEQEIRTGHSRGRRYPKGMERPGFIHPSSEPLKASMEKQEQLKSDIRLLIKLTISNLKGPKMASAESKQEDSRSLESGLSYIGLALEMAERKIAYYWAMYLGTGEPATISYPEDYSLRSEEDRQNEVELLENLLAKIPSRTLQQSLAIRIAKIVLGPKVSRESFQKIENEIKAAKAIICDPDMILRDVEAGLVSLDTASELRGYPEGEAEHAKEDHAERLARIADAQQAKENPGARGIKDAEGDPKSGQKEKAASRDTTQDDVVTDKTRGKGQ